MNRSDLNRIFVEAIIQALEDAKNADAVPGYDLEDLIPDFEIIISQPDNYDLKALSYLLDSWADAVNHKLPRLRFGTKLDITYAGRLVIEARDLLQAGESICNQEILEFAKFA